MDYEIPFDIIGVILDNLTYNSDWESIRSLSQTCKDLIKPCQKRLFSTVPIHPLTATQLASVLTERPHLISYVLHLHYCYIDGQSDTRTDILLLRKFNQLQSLHIVGDRTDRGTAWDVMAQDLKVELIRLLRCPKLEYLSLTRVLHWPVSLFGNCPSLRQLKIGTVGLDDTDLTTFNTHPFPTACKPTGLSIGAAAFYALEELIAARWPDGKPVVDLSLLTILHDHSIHTPIEELTKICGGHIEILYFAYRFRMLADSNEFKALRVIIGKAHWNDLRRPPKCSSNVEEIYLMIQPANGKLINIEHVISWLNPALFPAL